MNTDGEATTSPSDQYWMRRALDLARHAESIGEVPVGAIIVRDDRLIADGWNAPIGSRDPTAHAEVMALRQAALALGNYRLVGCTLYVTLEPCVMCLGAMIHARVQRLVFGASDPLRGAVCSRVQLADADFFNHRIVYAGGTLSDDCGELLRNFFLRKRMREGHRSNALRSSSGDSPSENEGCYNHSLAGEVPKRS